MRLKGHYVIVRDYDLEQGNFILECLDIREHSIDIWVEYPVWAYPYQVPILKKFELPEPKYYASVMYHVEMDDSLWYLRPEEDFKQTGRCQATDLLSNIIPSAQLPKGENYVREYFVAPILYFSEEHLKNWINTIHPTSIFNLELISSFSKEEDVVWKELKKSFAQGEIDFSTYIKYCLVEDKIGNIFSLKKEWLT